MICLMGKITQGETENDIRSLKTSCELKIVNVLFNKRKKQDRLKRVGSSMFWNELGTKKDLSWARKVKDTESIQVREEMSIYRERMGETVIKYTLHIT